MAVQENSGWKFQLEGTDYEKHFRVSFHFKHSLEYISMADSSW